MYHRCDFNTPLYLKAHTFLLLLLGIQFTAINFLIHNSKFYHNSKVLALTCTSSVITLILIVKHLFTFNQCGHKRIIWSTAERTLLSVVMWCCVCVWLLAVEWVSLWERYKKTRPAWHRGCRSRVTRGWWCMSSAGYFNESWFPDGP